MLIYKQRMNKLNLYQLAHNLGQKKPGVSKGPQAILNHVSKEFKQRISRQFILHEPKNFNAMYNILKHERKTDNKNGVANKTIILGGDHSISIATIPTSVQQFPGTKIVWIDTHADFNTPSISPSGNLHGMPLALACDLFPEDHVLAPMGGSIKPSDLFFIGLRDVDPLEQELLDKHNIIQYTSNDVIHKKEDVLKHLDEFTKNDVPLHISMDIDVYDKSLVPGTGTPVEHGIEFKDAKKILDVLKQKNWRNFELVEVNPELDIENKTAKLAAKTLEYFLGI